MALRRDLKQTVTIFAPSGVPEDHTILNARDLLAHASYTTEPPATVKVPEAVKKAAGKPKTSPEQAAINDLLSRPVDLFTKEELQAFALEAFGTQIDKRLTAPKAFDQIKTIADSINYKLILSSDAPAADGKGADEGSDAGDDEGKDDDADADASGEGKDADEGAGDKGEGSDTKE